MQDAKNKIREYKKKRKFDAAIQLCIESINLFKEEAYFQLEHAVLLFHAGYIDLAKSKFEENLHNFKNNSDAWIHFARYQLITENRREMLNTLVEGYEYFADPETKCRLLEIIIHDNLHLIHHSGRQHEINSLVEYHNTKIRVFNLKLVTLLVLFYFVSGNQNKFNEFIVLLHKQINLGHLKSVQNAKDLNFINAYFHYLLLLKDNFEVIRADARTIFHIGDSHSLTLTRKSFNFDNKLYQIMPMLLIGAKAYHFTKNNNNIQKSMLKDCIKALPKNTDVILSFGEIDCRGNEGIISYCKKYGASIDEIAKKTATNYLEYLRSVFEDCAGCRAVYVSNVPAPMLIPMEDIRQRLNIIRAFNRYLKEGASEKNFKLLDIYAQTAEKSGFSKKQNHLDSYHVTPESFVSAYCTTNSKVG